ncbi:GNAT family N-acyltransferase [Frankia sp. CiP3]|uniref:N-acyl amino acid synthase FeeM domain-containing protein n=1 Tax=Frankia sp. CiP3 TaxID=2880971 RepID=UPI001EF69176|nr:GNAT family N-acyltransferase [Frankia sp. CiP3]
MVWKFVEEPRPTTLGRQVFRARTDADFEQVATLWEAVYGKEFGWLPSDAGGSYQDRYDAASTYLLASVDGVATGTMRLVADSPEGLPVEQFVSIADLRGEKRLIECQRLMILPEYRTRRWDELPYGVLGGLVKGCLHWCLANGFNHILADLFTQTATTPIRPLMALGFEETGKEFIDTELDEDGTSVALLLRVGELFSRTFRTSNPFYRYLMTYDEAIDVYV